MRETGGLWAAAPDTGGSMEEEALRLLDESQGYLRAILLGVALQYHSLDIERCRLLAEGQNRLLAVAGEVKTSQAPARRRCRQRLPSLRCGPCWGSNGRQRGSPPRRPWPGAPQTWRTYSWAL